MPELPEVETIVRGMHTTITGRTIMSMRLSGMKMRTKRVSDFNQEIVGKIIVSVLRRGKYIIIRLDDNSHIIIHLGMSGKILIGNNLPNSRHDHAIFMLSGGSISQDACMMSFPQKLKSGESNALLDPILRRDAKQAVTNTSSQLKFDNERRMQCSNSDISNEQRSQIDDGNWYNSLKMRNSVGDDAQLLKCEGYNMVFNDPRRFGVICYTKEDPMKLEMLKSLGVEPLTTDFNSEFFASKLSRSKAPVKSILMNANVVVGVGNIYACESLFDAGVHPANPANQVSLVKVMRLVEAIKLTLESAIASGGSTLRDYVRSNGDIGGFQHQFKVYGRKDKPCTICGVQIVMTRLAGRSTYYCPNCQEMRLCQR